MDKVYIISLPSRLDRREKMKRRMDYHNLDYEFVDAPTENDAEVLSLGEGSDRYATQLDEKLKCSIGKEHACFVAHLRALKKIWESGNSGIILEDDAILHKDFNEIFKKLDKNTTLIMLYSEPIINEQHANGIYNINNNWCTSGYWVSNMYAKKAYELYHTKFKDINFCRKTSEVITILSGGKFILPQLVLEDPINMSSLRDSRYNVVLKEYHKKFQKYLNFHDYIQSETENYKSLFDQYFNYINNIKLAELTLNDLDTEQQFIYNTIYGKNMDNIIDNCWWAETYKIIYDLNDIKNVKENYIVYLSVDCLQIKNFDSLIKNCMKNIPMCISNEKVAYIFPKNNPDIINAVQGPVLYLRNPICHDITNTNLKDRIVFTRKCKFDYINYTNNLCRDRELLLKNFLMYYTTKKVEYDLFDINIDNLNIYEKYSWYDLCIIHAYSMNLTKGIQICKDFLKFAKNNSNLILPRIKYFSKNMEYYDTDGKQMLIVGHSGLNYNLESPKTGIFGSEEAIIYLSQILSKKYNITIVNFNNIDDIHSLPFNNPRFVKQLEHEKRYDVGILWRSYSDIHSICDKVYAWFHDIWTPDWTRERLLSMNSIFLLSNWHLEQFKSRVDMSDIKVVICGNGIIQEHFDIPMPKKNKYSFIYTSCYARGLIILLKLWPEIKNKYPDATLDLCYGWNLWNQPLYEQEELKNVYENTKHLDITDHGKVGHKELISIMNKCSIWAYPCIFAETFCITAVKMQCCGVVPIVHKYAGLDETVDYGYNTNNLNNYKNLLFDSLKNIDLWTQEKREEMALTVKNKWSWNNVAEIWLNTFN